MHRHGFKGRKLQLAAAPRKALIRGQVTSLILHEQITTTEAKAKEIAPYFERLVTKAKNVNLHKRRQIRAFVLTENATEKLITEIAPAFAERNGGYTRIVKLGNRLGDNAKMAAVMLTDKPLVAPAKPVGEKKAKALAERAKTNAAPKAKAKPKAAAKPAPEKEESAS